jgi:hypothetical protein
MSAESSGDRYGSGGSQITLSEWAKARDPDLFVVSKSEPEPVFLDYNLIAVSRDPQESRDLLRKWERVQPADAGVGFVAMSRSSEPPAVNARLDVPTGEVTTQADPQQVAGHAGRKIIRGALPGAIIGAIVLGILAAILTPDEGNVIGAALGGAAIGFVAGGVISFVMGTGWGEAYKESFIEPDLADIAYSSLHTNDRQMIAKAAEVARQSSDDVISLDRQGNPVAI